MSTGLLPRDLERVLTVSPAPLASVLPVERPAVSFVSVTYGSGRVMIDCIESVVRSTRDSELSIEFIVVDNPHADDRGRTYFELVLSTAGVLLLSPGRNLGFAGGCELGALHARGDTLAFVNPDLVVDGRWLDPLVARLSEPGVSIVAPLLRNDDGTVQEAGSRLFSDGSTGPILDPTSDLMPDYASAACWLIDRAEHERVGGFDPAFYPAFYEDADFSLRARQLGGRTVVAAETSVVHLRGAGTLGGSRVTDTTEQRDELLRRHPAVRWQQPTR